MTTAEWQTAKAEVDEQEQQANADLAVIPRRRRPWSTSRTPRKDWQEFTLDEQRAFIRRYVAKVTIRRATRHGRPGLDTDRVQIEFVPPVTGVQIGGLGAPEGPLYSPEGSRSQPVPATNREASRTMTSKTTTKKTTAAKAPAKAYTVPKGYELKIPPRRVRPAPPSGLRDEGSGLVGHLQRPRPDDRGGDGEGR